MNKNRSVKDLQKLAILDFDNTLLHKLAINKELDLLFATICIGVDQRVRDEQGKLFVDYLQEWEYLYLKQRYDAWKIGKLWVNVYKNSYETYLLHGYSLIGKPLISLIWEKQLPVEWLERVLDAGVNLDDTWIRNAQPDGEYALCLARYGWVPRECKFSSVWTECRNFYIPQRWNLQQAEAKISVFPIKEPQKNALGKTIVSISDTHWEHRCLHVPGGDFLVCSGDLCMPWNKDLTDFLLWMGSQSHTYKILVAGNHDKILQNEKEHYLNICKEQKIVYLEDSGVEIEGLKFWGSPWTPKRPRNKNNAFTLSRPELMTKWNLIPPDTDVLVTHCPPYGIGDCNTEHYKGPPYQGGDFGLRKTINRLPNLKLHLFGHQHFGRGLYKSNTGIYFANSAIAQKAVAYVFT